MGMPQLVVTAVLVEGRSKSEVARTYGVSRRWVITLVQRYLAEGDEGLAPRSRRPGSSPQRTAQELEDEIVGLRKELDRDGHDAGAATIAFHLEAGTAAPRRRPQSGESCPPAASSRHSRTSARRAATCGSRPSSPTIAGSSTPPTGGWPTAPTWRSSTPWTTTPGSASAVPHGRCSPPPRSTGASVKPLPAMAIRPAC